MMRSIHTETEARQHLYVHTTHRPHAGQRLFRQCPIRQHSASVQHAVEQGTCMLPSLLRPVLMVAPHCITQLSVPLLRNG